MYLNLIKKLFLNTPLILGIIILFGCSNQSAESKIEGKWLMTKVIQHDNDVSSEHNPEGDRWIEFLTDGTFKSGGTPFGENHGSWYLKNDEKVLYLDSSAENDDSEWNLVINQAEMQWTGIGDPGKEAFTLIFSKP